MSVIYFLRSSTAVELLEGWGSTGDPTRIAVADADDRADFVTWYDALHSTLGHPAPEYRDMDLSRRTATLHFGGGVLTLRSGGNV